MYGNGRVLEASGFAEVARYKDEAGARMIRYERLLNGAGWTLPPRRHTSDCG